jgi:hypothetical protein
MRRYGMWITLALLIVVNTIVLTGIAYNRSGEPIETLALTERELSFNAYGNYNNRENTGLSLKFDWQTTEFIRDLLFSTKQQRDLSKEWFNREKLKAIGFDCSLAPSDSRAELYYRHMLPRKTFAVLEYEGAAWKSWLAGEQAHLLEIEKLVQEGKVSSEELKRDRKFFKDEQRTRSRLYVIDVGNNPDALLQQYSEKQRYLILPATVRLDFYPKETYESSHPTPAYITGRVTGILNDTLNVPKAQASIIERLWQNNKTFARRYRWDGHGADWSPSYKATVHIGKRHEPWISSIQELHAGKTK